MRFERGVNIDFRLYLISDRKALVNGMIVEAIGEALQGGVKAVQLREKDLDIRDLLDLAYRIRTLTSEYGAKLFINDRVDIALVTGADGVHLGRNGMPPSAAKGLSKGDLIVGVSTHSFDEAVAAEKEGADFITFGPVYETPSKLKYGKPLGLGPLKEVCGKVSVPVFAIGGINPEKVNEVLDCGAAGAAVISAILGTEHITKSAETFFGYLP
jgi:thiamine-phosphate pyrophosphorylase